MKNKKIERCENCKRAVNAKLISWVTITKTERTTFGDDEIEIFERWCKKCKDAVEEPANDN